MATIKRGLERVVRGDTVHRCAGAIKTRLLFFQRPETIEPTKKTDPYVPVGNDARCCNFHEVFADVLKTAVFKSNYGHKKTGHQSRFFFSCIPRRYQRGKKLDWSG